MLRSVERSVDVGLTFFLQYVWADEETLRVSRDSLASLNLSDVDGDSCWSCSRWIRSISPVNQLSGNRLSPASKPQGLSDAIQRCIGHGFSLLATLLENEIQLFGVID